MKRSVLAIAAIVASGLTPVSLPNIATPAFAQAECDEPDEWGNVSTCVEVHYYWFDDPVCHVLNTGYPGQGTYYVQVGEVNVEELEIVDGPLVFSGKSGNATVLRHMSGGGTSVDCQGWWQLGAHEDLAGVIPLELTPGEESVAEVQVCQNVGGRPQKQGVAIDDEYTDADCLNPRV